MKLMRVSFLRPLSLANSYGTEFIAHVMTKSSAPMITGNKSVTNTVSSMCLPILS
jgi:hypothetical protein